MQAHALIPVLLVVLLIGLISMLYSLWRELGTLSDGDQDIPEIDYATLQPYSGRDWRRDDLP
jgi:hypothetical protein